MKNAMGIVFGLVLTAAIFYGLFWVTKTLSYQIFYKDMVMETVKDMVKPEALKKVK